MSAMSKNEKDELACVYAGLVLFDDKIEITADKINKILVASGNTTVESYYPEFFAKYLNTCNLDTLLTNIGSSGAAPATAAVVAPVEAAKKDDKKDDKKDAKKDVKKPAKKEPEPEPEEEEGMGGLFD